MISIRNKSWTDLSSAQRGQLLARGALQTGLSVAALLDIWRRPAATINGDKRLWAGVALVNYLGLGPMAYFLFGRKRERGYGQFN